MWPGSEEVKIRRQQLAVTDIYDMEKYKVYHGFLSYNKVNECHLYL